MTGVLGCAESYSAVIHWRGGGQPLGAGLLEGVTAISWNRALSDISTAQVTLAKPAQGSACCDMIAQITEWCHELSIYRDSVLVWQGPVIDVTEHRDSVVIDASDIAAWLTKLVNRFPINYTGIDATSVALAVITRNLMDKAMSVPTDYPAMLKYVKRVDCGSKPTISKGTWIAYVSDIVDELQSYGFYWTTIGRTYYLRDRATTAWTPQATLRSTDIAGGITVTRAGSSAATACFAIVDNQDAEGSNETPAMTYWTGTTGTPYGRLDTLVSYSDTTTTEASLRQGALAALGGRYPAPVTLHLPESATLLPTAPVTVQQLVCGERIDVTVTENCRPVAQGFRLTDVTASWTETGEVIQISCTSLTITAEGAA